MVRKQELHSKSLDIPNTRRSHVRPTTRGGGIAVVIVSLVSMIVLARFGWIETRLSNARAGGGSAVALVRRVDDCGRIGIVGRFTNAAAKWATAWLGGMAEIQWGENLVRLGYFGSLFAVLGTVWALNLIKFMDGIDRIAASHAKFMSGAGAALAIPA